MDTLQIDDAHTQDFKIWVIKRLEDISDADSDVLADYVIALIKSDDPIDQIRANCVENLEDFLLDHTPTFVNDVFDALKTKRYLPGYRPPRPQANAPITFNPSAPSFAASGLASSASPPANARSGPTSYQQPEFAATVGSVRRSTNKRAYDASEDHGQMMRNGGDRPRKQMRGALGGRGGMGGFQSKPIGQMASQNAGFPPIDPNNPMAALMAMQAMGFPMPGLEQMQNMAPAGQQMQHRQLGRCRDYDTKGFCAKGTACPFEHGSDHLVVPRQPQSKEYDPMDPGVIPLLPFNSAMKPWEQLDLDTPIQDSFQPRGRGRGNIRGTRGRGGPREGRGGTRGGRSEFSAPGPNYDTRNTKIVVEQIPEDKFNEADIRTFFSEFGDIEEITMQSNKFLAVLNFADWQSASRAYASPKVIFDNRFVKCYWFKDHVHADLTSANGSTNGELAKQETKQEDEIMTTSPEDFAQKQAEAQKAHEEKIRKKAEAAKERAELEKKQKAMAEERQALMAKLAAKAKKAPCASPAPAGDGETANAAPSKAEEKAKATEALRLKLARLEAEASQLGVSGEEGSGFPTYGGAYRGAYQPRGRGGIRGMGRGRGGFALRGGHWQGGSVARLDNRPKTVMVRALDEEADLADETTGEMLRAFLYGIGSFASIVPPSDTESGKQKTTTVAFHERYIAEMFIASGTSIPGVGKVGLTWVTNAGAPTIASSANTAKGDVDMDGVAPNGNGHGNGHGDNEVDWDVADEDERWAEVS